MAGPGPPPDTSRHAAIKTLAALGLTIALVTLVVAMRRSVRRWQSGPPAATAPAASATQPAATLPALDRLLASSASDFAAMQPGSEPLQGEPAGLPTPQALVSSPLQASRLAGFRRRQNRVAEEVAIWSIRGASPEAVDDFFRTAAVQQHFTDHRAPAASGRGAATSGASRALSRLMVRTAPPPGDPPAPAGPQSLIISIRPVSDTDDELRVTLWLRYPIMPP